MSEEKYSQKLKRFIGLRNIVTAKTHWRYLLLYEVDSHEESDIISVLDVFRRIETSFIAYKTKHGAHVVGLSPLDSQQWGYWFGLLQRRKPEYFSGQTLRLSLKENEKQELIELNLRYPYLERLARMYFKRFDIKSENIALYHNPPVYSCVFEKYWTGKI